MNKKITLFSLKCLFFIGFSQSLIGQEIYSNGSVSTGATSASGVAAPSGYTWSELQNDAGNTTQTNNLNGYAAWYNNAGSANAAAVDDFIVPAGYSWTINSFDFFVYQTNHTGTEPPIDGIRVQIFNSDPQVSSGGLIAGNLTTNVYDATNSGDALIYRIGNSVVPAPGSAPGTTRKIWKVRANLATSLPPGTYWVMFQVHATNDVAVFMPSVTVVGSRSLPTWNAKQVVMSATPATWSPYLDTGAPAATAPDVPQDMPFIINGTITDLGVSQNNFDAQMVSLPNPVGDVLTFSVPSNINVTLAAIYDVNGKLLKETVVTNDINVAELAKGNYILKLTSDSGEVSKKFIKN